MAEASPVTVHLGFDAEGFEKAAMEYLSRLVGQFVTVDGKPNQPGEGALELIDSVENDIQRMRIDEALKASLVAKLDELRKAVK